MTTFRCTGCGKSLSVAEEDSGQRVVCSACGTYLQAPRLAAIPDPPAPSFTEPAPIPPPIADEPLDRSSSESPRRGRWGWALPLSIVWAALLLGSLWAFEHFSPDPWEKEHAPHLLALKAQAEQLEHQGKLDEAHQTYARLQQEVALHDFHDQSLKSQIEAAHNDQERLFAILVNRKRPAGPPVVQAIRPIRTLNPPRHDTAPAPANPPHTPLPQTRPVLAQIEPATRPAPASPPPIVERTIAIPRPPARTFPVPTSGITDEQIGQGIQRLVDQILAQFNGPQLRANNPYGPGLEVLAVYSLLQASQAISDERLNVKSRSMKAMLDHVRELSLDGRYETYSRGLRATALAVYNRPEDRQVLRSDVQWLLGAQYQGAYSYGVTRGAFDNSNSQYGLLGVWSGAEVGAEVPTDYWQQVQNHWRSSELQDGQFGYGGRFEGSGRLSMTVAGIASLFVTHDYLEAPKFGAQVGREPFSEPLARGLRYLEEGDHCVAGHSGGYSLYGLERVGLASGFKYFGQHDWYRELAERLVNPGGWRAMQMGVGRFRGDLVEDSYDLLFLARGRHPVLMNKLRFDGYWANRPRDLANLARFASREMERPLNWQVVPISREWTDWTDSPIVYLASHQPIPLKEGDYLKLRRFVDAGGMIFTQADGNSEKFNTFVVEMARKVFPGFEFRDLPADSEIYSLNYQINPKPRLRVLTNGSRILWVHSPEDISMHWQLRAEKTKRNVFELGLNLFIYAAGKSDLRNRLVSTVLPPPPQVSDFNVHIARVRYGGLWDPEPGSMDRFSKWFPYQTGYSLQVTNLDPGQLKVSECPLAYLTGTAAWTASDAQVKALHDYVESGGVLFVDACGGAAAFGNSISTNLLPRAFPGAHLDPMRPDHPVLAGNGDGMEPLKLAIRPATETKIGKGQVQMLVLSQGKGKVIFSPVDITTGLLGTNTFGIIGYRPAYAQSFLRNLLLWVVDGMPPSYLVQSSNARQNGKREPG